MLLKTQGLRAAIVVIVCALALVGCDTRGINDPDAFGVRFNNDLSVSVVLALCHSDHSAACEHPYYTAHVKPGSAIEENISPDVRTEWAIKARDESRLLRCVVLYRKHWPGHDMQVNLSQAPHWAVPCPRATPASPLR